MKNKGAKQKLKRKGAASAFGCDLTEYLESSGQDGNVPPPRGGCGGCVLVCVLFILYNLIYEKKIKN